MSTRATYEFRDAHASFTVYKHHDGYPKGGLRWIQKALSLSWTLPRFEASEFAAAFVAANKDQAGGVYLTTGPDTHSDTDYHYIVSARGEELYIEIYGNKLSEEGTLTELLAKYAPAV